MELLRYRCVSKHPVELNLNDMGKPVQLCFEPVGDGVLSVLNNFQSCSPIVSPAQAARLNVGSEYVFEMVEVSNE